MVEFNNKTISYFFIGVLIVLGLGYAMSGGSKIWTGYAVSNQTCTDTDGGINYYVVGRLLADYPNGTHVDRTDFCTGSGNYLIEYYCTSFGPTSETYICPCVNGACVMNTTTTTTYTTSTTSSTTTYTTSTTSSTIIVLNQTGKLYVASKPTGANVYLNNVLKGRTNITITNLTPNSYNLKLTKSGYLDWVTKVFIYNGKTSYVNARLQPNAGSINATSIPNGASIYLDNMYQGLTNRILTNITAGSYNIKLSKTGYNDYFRNLTVKANVTSQVNAVLIPKILV